MSACDWIIEDGGGCGQVVVDCPRGGLLVDGRDYYRAVYAACVAAQRSIYMLGWQFDSRVSLLIGDDARDASYPVGLLAFLSALCKERPDLEVRLLAWESSPLFAFEREPLQSLTFRLRSHRNLRFEVDNRHPVTGSQHQKAVIVDRSIAFVGGMDLCSGRWDDRAHLADDARRAKPWPARGQYAPYHDVQAYVTGDAVDYLRDWFVERWERATGEELELPDAPHAEVAIEPTIEVCAPRIALPRTLPDLDDLPCKGVSELRELHLRAIAAARDVIYIENQYFSSDQLRDALIDRMRRGGDRPLEIAIILPHKTAGLKEQISIGVHQVDILRELGRVAAETGNRVGVYYQAVPSDDGEVPVFIHAKVLAVDDRFLLVSSANTTERSMGLDTELGVAWEAPEPTASLRDARVSLLGEQCGLDRDDAPRLLADPAGLIDRLDQLAASRSHRLREHPMDEDDEPGRTIARILGPDLLDPGRPPFGGTP